MEERRCSSRNGGQFVTGAPSNINDVKDEARQAFAQYAIAFDEMAIGCALSSIRKDVFLSAFSRDWRKSRFSHRIVRDRSGPHPSRRRFAAPQDEVS
jgi:hypothetical protein